MNKYFLSIVLLLLTITNILNYVNADTYDVKAAREIARPFLTRKGQEIFTPFDLITFICFFATGFNYFYSMSYTDRNFDQSLLSVAKVWISRQLIIFAVILFSNSCNYLLFGTFSNIFKK